MEEEKEAEWCFLVKTQGQGYLDNSPSYFRNKDRAVALERARGFIKISIQRYCTNYKMGKELSGLNKIVFTLLSSGTLPEEIIEQHRVSEYLGNHSL